MITQIQTLHGLRLWLTNARVFALDAEDLTNYHIQAYKHGEERAALVPPHLFGEINDELIWAHNRPTILEAGELFRLRPSS